MRVVNAIVCGGLLASFTVGWSGKAGEKLQLSGERNSAVTKEETQYLRGKLKPSSLRGKGEVRRPSLQGMTTSPFQLPHSPTTRPLTKEEFQRLQDKANWIFQDSEQGQLSDEKLYRALGIREFSEPQDPEKALTDSSSTPMERYLTQQAEGQEQAGALGNEPLPLQQLGLSSRQSPAALGLKAQEDRQSSLDFSSAERNREERFDPTQDGLSRREGGALQPFGLGRTGFGRSGRGGFNRTSSFWDRRSNNDLSGVANLLGSSPIESAIDSFSSSVTDPINAFPDLTRQEINPVTATGLARSSIKPLFPDPQAGKGRVAQAQLRDTARPSVLDSLPTPSRSYLPPEPKRSSSLDPAFSPTKSVHTHLEIPRRTF